MVHHSHFSFWPQTASHRLQAEYGYNSLSSFSINLEIILCSFLTLSVNSPVNLFSTHFLFCTASNWVSNAEPYLISTNFLFSFVLRLALPSAMLLGIDIAHRVIWERNPNRSSGGSIGMISYTLFTISVPNCHIWSFLKSLIVILLSFWLQAAGYTPQADCSSVLILYQFNEHPFFASFKLISSHSQLVAWGLKLAALSNIQKQKNQSVRTLSL